MSLVSLMVLAAVGAALVAPVMEQHVFERGPHFHLDARDNLRPHLHAYQLQDRGDGQSATPGPDLPVGAAMGPLQDSAAIALFSLAIWVLNVLTPVAGVVSVLHSPPTRAMRRPLLAARADRPPQW